MENEVCMLYRISCFTSLYLYVVLSMYLLLYGAGKVIPTTLTTIHPNLTYSLMVSLALSAQYGRIILVTDKNFCTDAAGNKFARSQNSWFILHYDRRNVVVNLRTHIPEKLLQLNRETRTVQATNTYKTLELYLYFNKPVTNSVAEISNSIHTTQGSLLPIVGDSLGNRRFGFQVNNISSLAIVTVSVNSDVLASRYGSTVSPVAPVTFLYDSQRPVVRLSTTSNMRTRHRSLPILIRFMEPVFGFNSSHISVSGGYVQGFREVSMSSYSVDIHIQEDGGIVSINVPENITKDVAGNGNQASNVLQVKHYSLPAISLVLSSFATATFILTALAAGLLTISVASLQSIGAFGRRSSSLTTDPTRNLFRIACHIQTFALSRWLAVTLPVEYHEFARGLQWSIPYLCLPWDIGRTQSVMVPSSSPTIPHSSSSKFVDLGILKHVQLRGRYADVATPLYGLPLSPAEYRSFFESQNIPEAEYISSANDSDGWSDFKKSMFWLAVLGGSLLLLHVLLLLILKFRKTKTEKQKIYGAMVLPRFEIFLIMLALPCVCAASAALLKGGSTAGTIVGSLLLAAVSFAVLALFLFLSAGITYGKLLQYKEVHKEGQKSHWYQELIRVTLGPGKRGQWTWINQSNSVNLTKFGPLFEDLRGPPKYMLSQFVAEDSHINGDRIIASDDETEDAEAPFIQKFFGILRIYYTLIETIKRVCLGILAGANSENWTSKAPTIILFCITSFQLFFMVLKKPFIKKKVQLVEIISVCSELGLFAICFILLEKTFSVKDERNIGICMLSLFLLAFLPQMINEWYALYRQTQQLDPAGKSLWKGLKAALVGFLLYLIPQKLMKNMYDNLELHKFGDKGLVDPSSSGDRNRSSGSRTSSGNERPWMKQLRELAKSSFSKDRSGTTTANDPSTSGTRWSGLWGGTRGSRSSSLSTSGDTKSKPKGLYKDLEAIFASK
ncbi:uncharacterized protein LOC141689652 isoform X2 [Apium graveolens]|uniref:uncharacterized protein LOC141689652 isoform X2 n=1 Tax=Apium graveolens TaxID=4045 RepID=UPI003D792B3B